MDSLIQTVEIIAEEIGARRTVEGRGDVQQVVTHCDVRCRLPLDRSKVRTRQAGEPAINGGCQGSTGVWAHWSPIDTYRARQALPEGAMRLSHGLAEHFANDEASDGSQSLSYHDRRPDLDSVVAVIVEQQPSTLGPVAELRRIKAA